MRTKSKVSPEGEREDKGQPLPGYIRYYIYGVQGFAYEIVFTAVFDFFTLGNGWTLRGHSAISSFFIYGTCSFMVERLYVFLYYKHGLGRHIRIPLMVCIAYSWEFVTGLILRQFDACPWDYSHYPYNFMGLITLEYAPGWAFLGYVQDEVADYLLHLRTLPSSGPSGKHIFLLHKPSGEGALPGSSRDSAEQFSQLTPEAVTNGVSHRSNWKTYYTQKQQKYSKNNVD